MSIRMTFIFLLSLSCLEQKKIQVISHVSCYFLGLQGALFIRRKTTSFQSDRYVCSSQSNGKEDMMVINSREFLLSIPVI